MKLGLKNIEQAKKRIDPFIHNTPIFSSQVLNSFLGHKIFFKAEELQKIGAFKIRGGINTIAWLIEKNEKPKRIIANSSGNHAQAVALASKIFSLPSTVYMPKNVSTIKAQAAAAYGAEIILCENRIIADELVQNASRDKDVYWIPPFDHEQVICGQGTAAHEALTELSDIDALFAPCGGGGLLSGSLISTRGLSPRTKVIGVEPELANDAVQSVNSGNIVRLTDPPDTIADGARTMSVGELTFHYLKELDEFFQATEKEIIYWTQWLTHLLKVQIEPTCALTMAGVTKWLKSQNGMKSVLVILSGANIDLKTMNQIWQKDYLSEYPSLQNC